MTHYICCSSLISFVGGSSSSESSSTSSSNSASSESSPGSSSASSSKTHKSHGTPVASDAGPSTGSNLPYSQSPYAADSDSSFQQLSGTKDPALRDGSISATNSYNDELEASSKGHSFYDEEADEGHWVWEDDSPSHETNHHEGEDYEDDTTQHHSYHKEGEHSSHRHDSESYWRHHDSKHSSDEKHPNEDSSTYIINIIPSASGEQDASQSISTETSQTSSGLTQTSSAATNSVINDSSDTSSAALYPSMFSDPYMGEDPFNSTNQASLSSTFSVQTATGSSPSSLPSEFSDPYVGQDNSNSTTATSTSSSAAQYTSASQDVSSVTTMSSSGPDSGYTTEVGPITPTSSTSSSQEAAQTTIQSPSALPSVFSDPYAGQKQSNSTVTAGVLPLLMKLTRQRTFGPKLLTYYCSRLKHNKSIKFRHKKQQLFCRYVKCLYICSTYSDRSISMFVAAPDNGFMVA